MRLTKEQLEEATIITSSQYNELKDPTYIGQSALDEKGYYKMYWKDSGIIYATQHKIFS